MFYQLRVLQVAFENNLSSPHLQQFYYSYAEY